MKKICGVNLVLSPPDGFSMMTRRSILTVRPIDSNACGSASRSESALRISPMHDVTACSSASLLCAPEFVLCPGRARSAKVSPFRRTHVAEMPE
jgi:hypothetical protein